MSDCLVTFNNGKRKLFTGSTSTILRDCLQFCELHNLTTVEAKWNLPREDVKMKDTIKESDGKHNGELVYCPVNGTDCPYYEKGICYIKNPIEECDDFASFWKSWEVWEDCGDSAVDDDDEDDDYYPEYIGDDV